jgi:two-component system sensor histidine kinase TctE
VKRPASLRLQLMIGILVPVIAVVAINTVSVYRQALHAADVAYDRTLLASAKSLGEQLEVVEVGSGVRLQSSVPYAALEPFEADNRSRMYYRVSGFDGEMVSGFQDLPRWQGSLPVKGRYAALVDFYDDRYRDQPVRMAVLLQPVAGVHGQGMATIQVAETLELRQGLARQILFDTLWRQALLLAVIAAVVVWVVQRATHPVRRLSASLAARSGADLTPVDGTGAPRELRPLLDAMNELLARMRRLMDHQKRFVRDASHQLRTPLAVLKAQTQSALRGDVDPTQALHEIHSTLDRATQLANQMLALAKVEQLRSQGDAPLLDWSAVVQAVSLDLSALIAQHEIDFELELQPCRVRAHEWALRELTRNLLHNAVRHGAGRGLHVRLVAVSGQAVLRIADQGPGLSDEQRQRLFQPFASSSAPGSVGLGLAIAHEVVQSLGGTLTLDNRLEHGRVTGLDATVRLALVENAQS